MSETRLFIGDVKTCAKEDLERAFAEFGELKEVWVARDPAGFAFVEYFDKEAALNALHAMNNKVVNNDTIRVELSKVKKSARSDHPRSGAPYPRRGGPGRGSHRGYGPPPLGARYSHDIRGYGHLKSSHHPYSTPPYYAPESRYYDDRGPLPPPGPYHGVSSRSGPPAPLPPSYAHHSRYPDHRHEYDDYYYAYPPPPPSSRRYGPPGPPHRDNGSSMYAPPPSPYSRGSRYDPYAPPPPHYHYPESDRYGPPPLEGIEPYPPRGSARLPKIERDRAMMYDHPEKGVLGGGRPPPRERPPPPPKIAGGEGHTNDERAPNSYRNGYDMPPDPSINIIEHGTVNRRRNLSSPQTRLAREFPPNRQYSPREYEKEYPPPVRAHQPSYPNPHRASPRHY